MTLDKGPTPLPVLCMEDGKAILRFSEIFGIHEPVKKRDRRDLKYPVPRGMCHIKDYPKTNVCKPHFFNLFVLLL